MNSLKNKVQLIGNLGDDPKITDFENGKKVANFSLATNETYKDSKGKSVQKTEWHNIVAWGKTASIVENNLKKGNQVLLDGKLTYNNYEDKEGAKRKITEIVAKSILFIPSPDNTKAKDLDVE